MDGDAKDGRPGGCPTMPISRGNPAGAMTNSYLQFKESTSQPEVLFDTKNCRNSQFTRSFLFEARAETARRSRKPSCARHRSMATL